MSDRNSDTQAARSEFRARLSALIEDTNLPPSDKVRILRQHAADLTAPRNAAGGGMTVSTPSDDAATELPDADE